MEHWFDKLEAAKSSKEVDRLVADIVREFPLVPQRLTRAKDIFDWAVSKREYTELADLMDFALDMYYNFLMQRHATRPLPSEHSCPHCRG